MENIKETRLNGLINTIEYYSYISDNRTLSGDQIAQLTETRDKIALFGVIGQKWASFANSIIIFNGCNSYADLLAQGLENFVKAAYEKGDYTSKPAWHWTDEGLIYAIMDYHSSTGEFSGNDIEYLKTLGLCPADFEEEEEFAN